MEEMFAKMMNPQGTASDMPDPAKLAQMLNLDGGGKEGGDGKLPFDENAMKDMEKLFGEISKEMGQSGPIPGMPSAAPGQQPEGGFDSMFKAFEKASQDHDKTQKESGAAGGDPLAAMLGALGGADGQDLGDDKMMGMLKGLMGQMGEAGPDGKGGSEDMFAQFGDFLKQAGTEDGMKGVLDSLVKDVVSKDSLYAPMKALTEEFPPWLETNWEKLSQEDLERYNKQMDKAGEICELFDKQEGAEVSQEAVFEKLNEM